MIMEELAEEILKMNHNLKEESISICFVIDGEKLPAKQITNKRRAHCSFTAFKKARRLAQVFFGKQDKEHPQAVEAFRQKFNKAAASWVRWFPDYKSIITKAFCIRGFANDFHPDRNCVVVAPFEADPVCVWLGDSFPLSMIFSNDGDLLAYPLADHCVVCGLSQTFFSLYNSL